MGDNTTVGIIMEWGPSELRESEGEGFHANTGGKGRRFGNASKFLAFIKEELIPFVSSRYRVDSSDRTLMGSSLGGLFTLYTMFHETNLFTRYILTSPGLMWDNWVIYQDEEHITPRPRSFA